MLSIHGSAAATCAQRVLVSFLELGLVEGKDFQLIEVGDLAQIKSPEWLEKQPFGQMPFIVDEETGAVIFESRAIARYAAAKYAPSSPLFPTPSSDLGAYAKFETGSSVEAANFDPYVKTLFVELFATRMHGGQTDPVKVDQAEEGLRAKMEGYERILSKQDWLGGDSLTLVDLWHIPFGASVVPLGGAKALTDGSFPHVAAWWAKLNGLQSWKVVNAKKEAMFAAFAATQQK